MPLAAPIIKRLEDSNTFRPIRINGYSAGGVGKTRLFAAAMRGWPEQFGTRAAYVCADPDSERLDSVLGEDRASLLRVGLDFKKDIYKQVLDIYQYDWESEGIKTVLTDTMTVVTQNILAQITNSGKFSEKHIDLGNGVNQPMQGDFLATQTLIMALMRAQQQARLNFLTLYHEQEVRPDPGQPGEPYGGPSTVGKALVKTVANLDMTVFRLALRPKRDTPLGQKRVMERVVYTDGHGIWQAKLRTPHLTNPISEIVMEPDPVNVWKTLKRTLTQE